MVSSRKNRPVPVLCSRLLSMRTCRPSISASQTALAACRSNEPANTDRLASSCLSSGGGGAGLPSIVAPRGGWGGGVLRGPGAGRARPSPRRPAGGPAGGALAGGDVGSAGGEQVEPLAEPLGDRLGGEHPDTGSGELDRERQSVEPAHQLVDVVVGLEVGACAAGGLGEEHDAIGRAEGLD